MSRPKPCTKLDKQKQIPDCKAFTALFSNALLSAPFGKAVLYHDRTNDVEQGVSINWTPYGKVRSVQKGDSTRTTYRYDASGNRVEKRAIIGDSIIVTTYLRDAGVM